MTDKEYVTHADDNTFDTLAIKTDKPCPGGFLGALVRTLPGYRTGSGRDSQGI